MNRLAWMLFLALAIPVAALAQTSQNAVVEASATVGPGSDRLNFTWAPNPTATQYTLYRRVVGTTPWTTLVTLPAAATAWTDSTITPGVRYEYRFDKAGTPFGRGTLWGGVDLAAVHDRGALVLVVADAHAGALATELARLEADMAGDGWRVIRHDVAPTASVPSVKALIAADWAAAPTEVKAVLLFGHVPVPYSGASAWDGHPDHAGAWPCDSYYGEMDGAWTDDVINNASASRPENRNIPGDGKFDQSTIPTDVELMVGRVDLANMPSFPAGERELLRAYLDKDHAYRHKHFRVAERSVIDDNFGYFGGEAFASSGWRSFAPMFGAAQNVAGDYFGTLNTPTGDGYLWSYGCGGGSYVSAGGVGSTSDFVTSTNRGVFTMLFGSYHGDWDSADNFMRASLCSGWTLSCAWAGRPAWSFASMAIGEPLGYAARVSMNDALPPSTIGTRGTHMGLLGDPTLRLHVVAPPTSLIAAPLGLAMRLDWNASSEAVVGYHVYREDSTGRYVLLTPSPISDTTYVDTDPGPGLKRYMVRAHAVQTSASGRYANLSQGTFGEGASSVGAPDHVVAQRVHLRGLGGNPFRGSASFAVALTAASSLRLEVFDASGRRVRSLGEGETPAGLHRREWDGRHDSGAEVAPGVYLIRAMAGRHSATMKLVKIR